MKVSTTIKDNFGIIKFDVDKILGIEAGEFQKSLVNLLDKNIKNIIVDLSRTKFVSSWGIGMLMHGLATTKNRSAEFRFAGMNEVTAGTLKIMKLYPILNIYDSVEAAMK